MSTITRSLFLALLLVCCFIAGSGDAFAHCQMPCGIYDDDARIQQMREDAVTIRKASDLIAAPISAWLSDKQP